MTRRSDGVEVTCRQFGGGRFVARWVPASDPAPATEGSLAEWLLERRRFVREDASQADDGDGRRYGAVERPPWRVRDSTGEVTARGLLAGLPGPAGEPVLHYSPGATVRL